jgi:hypothetical protein
MQRSDKPDEQPYQRKEVSQDRARIGSPEKENAVDPPEPTAPPPEACTEANHTDIG